MRRVISMTLVLLVVPVATGFAGGCANTSITDDPFVFDVAPTVPIAVDVESFNGDVIIEADDSLTQAVVTVTREATHGPRRGDEAEASLKEIDYTVDLVPGELGRVLTVKATTTHAEPHYQRVHVHLKAPLVEGVNVQTNNGVVRAVDIEGAIDISTTGKDALVATNFPLREPVRVTTREGDIDFRIRGESRGRFDVLTIGGTARYRQRYGEWELLPGVGSDRFRAVLNGGENPIVLRTTDGDIRVSIVSEPTNVGWWIVDP